MFRGGTSLRMAWHDRQNRKTTACRNISKGRFEIAPAIPCVGAAGCAREHQPAQHRESAAGKSKTRTAEICISEYV